MPFDRFPVPPAEIDFLFLTHTHIDHIGRVPDLIDAAFCGEIICTQGIIFTLKNGNNSTIV
ncbi:MBL fold metallo-hydrolase [Desulfobacter sp.]